MRALVVSRGFSLLVVSAAASLLFAGCESATDVTPEEFSVKLSFINENENW